MRTISASEANDPRPYSILYGGQHVSNLSRHPEQCITIVWPQLGIQQLLGVSDVEHNLEGEGSALSPQPSRFIFWESYS